MTDLSSTMTGLGIQFLILLILPYVGRVRPKDPNSINNSVYQLTIHQHQILTDSEGQIIHLSGWQSITRLVSVKGEGMIFFHKNYCCTALVELQDTLLLP